MNRTTILIVEDEAIVAADLAGKLRRLGFEVAGIAVEGEEAVDMAMRLRPDLMLMDIKLEGPVDGIDAAQAIRRRYDVPVIYLTAHSDAATLTRAKLTGPSGYILKPFEERELATQIELALHKHEADRQIHEQREWLRVTLNSIGDGVIATDAAGRITFVNPVTESLTAWKAGDAMGRPVPDVFRIVNERTGRPLEDLVARVLREGIAVTLANHTVLITKDGRSVPIEDSAAPILDAAGQVIGAVLVFHDVTEKRRSEEALRRSEEDLVRAQAVSQTGSWWLDVRSNTLRWSDESHRLFGIPKGTPLTYDTFLSVIPPEDRDFVDRKWKDALLGELYDVEHRIVVGGREKWVRERAELDFDSSGSLVRGFGTVQDITERKRMEEALRSSVAEKEVLLRELAHRTKNNMQVIGSLLSLQAASSEDEKFANVVAETRDRIRAMALVHENLYRSGNVKSLNMAGYIEDIVISMLHAHQGADGAVQPILDLEDIHSGIDAAFPCGLIISELISNSMKHAFPDGRPGAIFLSLRRVGEKVELKYRDNGPGLPRDLDLSRTKSLGLKLVYNLAVRQLRWAMDIRRDPVSEFVFTFHDLDQKEMA